MVKVPKYISLTDDYTTSKGLVYNILNYKGFDEVLIKFKETGYITNVYSSTIKTGNIKDKLNPEVYGVGYIGDGHYTCMDCNKINKSYKVWQGMLERCYSPKLHKNRPTYKGCSVSEDWHDFQNFAKWFDNNYIEGFELDKDILGYCTSKYKMYSPETCLFVPPEVNNLLVSSDATRGETKLGTQKHIEKNGRWEGRYEAKISSGVKGSRFLGIHYTEESAQDAYIKAKIKIIEGIISQDSYGIKVKEGLQRFIKEGFDCFVKTKNTQVTIKKEQNDLQIPR